MFLHFQLLVVSHIGKHGHLARFRVEQDHRHEEDHVLTPPQEMGGEIVPDWGKWRNRKGATVVHAQVDTSMSKRRIQFNVKSVFTSTIFKNDGARLP